MARAWHSSLVREMLLRTAEGGAVGGIEAFRPEHLPKHYGMQPDGCTSCPTSRRRRSWRCACSA